MLFIVILFPASAESNPADTSSIVISEESDCAFKYKLPEALRDDAVISPLTVPRSAFCALRVFMSKSPSGERRLISPKAFAVTIFITAVGTILNFFFTVTLAYPLSRKELPFKKFFTIYTFLPMVFNGGLIPTFYVVRLTGLMNTVWAMIIPILITTYNLTITRSFFQSIDNSYIEVARMEGMNEIQILFSIIVPLAKPVIATIVLMYGVMHWNTYYHALYYVRDADLQPLQVVLKGIIMKAQSTLEETSVEVTASTQAMKQAAVVITALPVAIVYPFLQKYFTKGMLVGGIKG